jgi:hypothetical protein
MRRTFVDGGVRVDHAVTSMPALTYSNSTSLITGCFPGHHGILGNQWFDRRTLEYQDYSHALSYRSVNEHFTTGTLFEILGDQFTISVQAHTQRGASQGIDHEALAAVDWYTQQYSNVDARVGYGIDAAFKLAEEQGRWPSVMLYYFPGVDEVGHQYGSDSQQYAEAVQVVDGAIGRICRSVQGTRLRRSTYFVLISDHGHVATPPGGTFALRDHLESVLGTTVCDGRAAAGEPDRPAAGQDDCGIVLVDWGARGAVLHVRGPRGWGSPAPAEQIMALVERAAAPDVPAVAAVVWREGPDRIGARSRGGRAVIERRLLRGVKEYRLTGGDGDPLQYASLLGAAVGETLWMSSRQWLQLTAASEFPDFVPQAMEMMDAVRAGDVVLFADENWSFDGQAAGTHGSCKAADMRIPLYFAGPGLPAGGRVAQGRLVDIMPTVLDLLGEGRRLAQISPIDGVSLVPDLEAAQPATASIKRSRPRIRPE